MAHVALCARCRREYAETAELVQLSEEVRQMEAQAEPSPAPVPAPVIPLEPPDVTKKAVRAPRFAFWQPRLSPGLGFAFGAVAAGILLLSAYVVPARFQRDRLEAALREREAQIARAEQKQREQEQQLAALKQHGQGEAVRLAEQLERLKVRVKVQGSRIARLEEDSAVLEQMPLPAAEWMTVRESDSLRDPNGAPAPALAITLLRPVNTAVREATPILECRPLAGVTAYEVTLVKQDSLEEVPPPKPLSATRWKVTAPLEPGVVYQWSVKAERDDERLRSPVARFMLLTSTQRQEAEAAREKYAQKPLLLGAIYARLGLREAAQQQLRAALKADPNSTVAKRWLEQIQARP
jgi:hypothetical protein